MGEASPHSSVSGDGAPAPARSLRTASRARPGRRLSDRPASRSVASGVALALLSVFGTSCAGSRPDEGLTAPAEAPRETALSGTRPPADLGGGQRRQGPRATPTRAQTGRAAPSQVDAQRPVSLTLPDGSVMRVRASATTSTGELQIPPDINQAGWWDGGSRLGDPFGAIVVAAHVDSFSQGVGRFAELAGMRPGDAVHLDSAKLSQGFKVVSSTFVPKESLSSAVDLFSADGSPRLVLITCGGAYDPSAGGYQSNVVVVGIPSEPVVDRRH